MDGRTALDVVFEHGRPMPNPKPQPNPNLNPNSTLILTGSKPKPERKLNPHISYTPPPCTVAASPSLSVS